MNRFGHCHYTPIGSKSPTVAKAGPRTGGCDIDKMSVLLIKKIPTYIHSTLSTEVMVLIVLFYHNECLLSMKFQLHSFHDEQLFLVVAEI